MSRLLRLLVVLLCLTVAMPLIGCPKNVGSAQYASAKALVGTWKDDSGCTYVIALEGETPRMVQVVDYDAEEFRVLQTGWRGGAFFVTYFVPSTEYTVDIVVLDQPSADELKIEWKNQYDTGREIWHRVPGT